MWVATMLSTTMRKSAAGRSATSEMRRGLPSRVTQPPIRKAQKATSRSASAACRHGAAKTRTTKAHNIERDKGLKAGTPSANYITGDRQPGLRGDALRTVRGEAVNRR